MDTFENTYQVDHELTVPEFYDGKSVFITGGTGFIGKVIIEKLLYSCPKIDKIYLLIREKDELDATERLKNLLACVVFNRIREKNPLDLNKLIAVAGNLEKPNLGISKNIQNSLINKISVVIHSAGEIKFQEKLSKILNANVDGLIRLVDFCKKIKHLEVFVHISTAYCNTDQKILKEIIYTAPASLSEVYSHLEKYGDNEKQTFKLLNGSANTYAYTKALAEQVVADNSSFVPSVIIRPSNVLSAKSEPFRGWIDSWSGVMVLLAACATGLMRNLIGNSSYFIDITPVDYVSNLTIVAAAKYKRSDKVKVYNSCTSASKPITLGKLLRLFLAESVQQDFGGIYPKIFVTNKWMAPIVKFFLEVIPVYLQDFCLFMRRMRSKYIKQYKFISNMRSLLEFYTTKCWVMRADNVEKLSDSLSRTDRRIFPFDPRDIFWPEYIKDVCVGLKNYLLTKSKKEKVN